MDEFDQFSLDVQRRQYTAQLQNLNMQIDVLEQQRALVLAQVNIEFDGRKELLEKERADCVNELLKLDFRESAEHE